MPIKGMTTTEARWPRLGVIRKGDQKVKGRVGRDLNEYLRFVGDDDSIHQDWIHLFGSDRIDALTIRFAYPDIDSNWSAWKEEWVAGGLVHRCDGENQVLWQDEAGEYQTDLRPCNSKNCKATGRLNLIVPEFQRMGTVMLTTTSINDIMNLDGCVRALAMQFGDLRQVPMKLYRAPRFISTPGGKGKRVRREAYLLHLEPEPEWVRMIAENTRPEPDLITGQEVHALPAPIDLDQSAAYQSAGDLDLPSPMGDTEVDSWTERIELCVSLSDLESIIPELETIDPTPYRKNVEKLLYRTMVGRLEVLVDEMTPGQLATAERKLSSLPQDTDGLSAVLDRVHNAQALLQEQMVEA